MAAEEVCFELPQAGVTLRGLRTSTHEGPPVVCLHGWLDNCAGFQMLFDELADLNLVAVDLPGHGLSDHLPSTTYQVLNYAACVLELAHTQGWDRFHLLGHSLGGMVSVLVAGIRPEKVDRMILVDPVVQRSSDPARLRESAGRYLAALMDGARPTFRTRSQAVRTRARGADCLLDTAELLSERDLVETPDGYTWRTDPRLRYPFIEALTEEQIQEFVRAITSPTLVLTAEQARVASPFDLAWAPATTPLRHTTLPGGHHLHIENPAPVAREIRAFLSEPEGDGAS
ncbi:alpha/beta fold hydrolase [Streptomyces sp. NBC_00005]|uniref:alpha/beta fold hydrolase n=1 Tax=Streptomyces sp. NBC_00005 TaxID=2903609 RepID=UPI003246EFA7